MVSGAINSNRDHSCISAMNPDVQPKSSSDPDFTVVMGSNSEATHLSSLFTSFTSSDIALPTGHEPSVFLFLPYHTIHLLTIVVAATTRCPWNPGKTAPGLCVVLLVLLNTSWPSLQRDHNSTQMPCAEVPSGFLVGGVVLLESSKGLGLESPDCGLVASHPPQPHGMEWKCYSQFSL